MKKRHGEEQIIYALKLSACLLVRNFFIRQREGGHPSLPGWRSLQGSKVDHARNDDDVSARELLPRLPFPLDNTMSLAEVGLTSNQAASGRMSVP